VPYNSNAFAARKCIHVKISMEHFESFRLELFKRRLSMQEVFDEFASLIAQNDAMAIKFIERITVSKNRQKMEKILGAVANKPMTANQEKALKKSKKEVSVDQDLADLLESVSPLNNKQ
jgi:hypothetical protein